MLSDVGCKVTLVRAGLKKRRTLIMLQGIIRKEGNQWEEILGVVSRQISIASELSFAKTVAPGEVFFGLIRQTNISLQICEDMRRLIRDKAQMVRSAEQEAAVFGRLCNLLDEQYQTLRRLESFPDKTNIRRLIDTLEQQQSILGSLLNVADEEERGLKGMGIRSNKMEVIQQVRSKIRLLIEIFEDVSRKY